MPIEIRDDWYYSAFFFTDGVLPGSDQRLDIMGTMYKESKTDDPTVPWKIIWRFRYYNDEHVFHSNDKKSWYSSELAPGSDTEKAVDKLELWIKTCTSVLSNVVNNEFIRINGNGKELVEKALTDKPWACRRKAPEGEGEDKKSADKFFDKLEETGKKDTPEGVPHVEWLQ